MTRSSIILLIVAASLIVVGLIIMAIGIGFVDFDVRKLSSSQYVTNTYVIDKDFSDICIEKTSADVRFVLSDKGQSKVVCYETDRVYHSVTVEDGVLRVSENDTREWYHHIGFFWDKAQLTVYVTEADLGELLAKTDVGDITLPCGLSFEKVDVTATTGDVEIRSEVKGEVAVRTSTGDVTLEGIQPESIKVHTTTGYVEISSVHTAESVDIEVDTGDVELDGVTCKSINCKSDTGKIECEDVKATDTAVLSSDTGDVILERFDASSIQIKTSTGDVLGTLLSGKTFLTQTDTGEVDVPHNTEGGICSVTTVTGDIRLRTP